MIAPSKLRDSERRAAAIVGAALPGTDIQLRDCGRGERVYDFDIVFPDGRCEALEVTESTHMVRRSQAAVLRQYEPWDAGTEVSWLVELGVGARVKTVRAKIGPLLRHFETAGYRHAPHYLIQTSYIPEPLLQPVFSLGVVSLCWQPGRDGENLIFLNRPGDGGVISGEQISAAFEFEAHKDDNLKKLAQATSAERHLFVWADPATRFMTWRSMQEQRRPPAVRLPPPITSGWIATTGRGGAIGWRAERPGEWHPFGPIAVEQ